MKNQIEVMHETLIEDINILPEKHLRDTLTELLSYKTHIEQEKTIIAEMVSLIRQQLGEVKVVDRWAGYEEKLHALMQADRDAGMELAKDLKNMTPTEYFEKETINKATFRQTMDALLKEYKLK